MLFISWKLNESMHSNELKQQRWSVCLHAVDFHRGKHWMAGFLVQYFIQNLIFTSALIILEDKNT